jgi:hypothetical protein
VPAGSDLFGKSCRVWRVVLDLAPHTRTMIAVLVAAIDEAHHHVEALTARLHEGLDGDFDMNLLVSIRGVDSEREAPDPLPGHPSVARDLPAHADKVAHGLLGSAWHPHARACSSSSSSYSFFCRAR